MTTDDQGRRWFIAPSGDKALYKCSRCGACFIVSDDRRLHLAEHAKTGRMCGKPLATGALLLCETHRAKEGT